MSSVTALVLVLTIVVASLASPLPQQPQQISSFSAPGHSQVRDDRGQYSYRATHHDGATAVEQAQLKVNRLGTDLILIKQGEYSYISPEGRLIRVTYQADEDGFRAQGEPIPVQQPALPTTF